MKKWRIILSSVLAVAAAVACGAAVGCKTGHKHSYESEWTTTETHHWHKPKCDDTENLKDYGEHTAQSDGNGYKCSVCSKELKVAGIAVEKQETQYTLNGVQTANIKTDDITVKCYSEGSIELGTLSSSDYTISYYKDDVAVTDLTGVTSGAYNIWAETEIEGEKVDAFVLVYVIDNVTDFRRTGSFTTSQALGLDQMSTTWNFNVTYSSGKSETINVSDQRIFRNNFTTFLKGDRQANVTFSERNCMGVEFTKSVDISYSVGAAAGNVVLDEYDFNALATALGDKKSESRFSLSSDEYFTGKNAFLKYAGGTVDYRGPSNNVLEIRGNGLLVTFEGVGVLEVKARGTGNSAFGSIALRDEDGNYVAAEYAATTTTIGKDDARNVYSVTGPSGANTLTFFIDKPGVYTICTVSEVIVNDEIIDTATKNTRIEAINKTDVKGAN